MSNNNNNEEGENKDEKKKKEKKSLTFKLPEEVTSEDSFISALSLNVQDNETEEFQTVGPVLRNFTKTPIRRSCPRAATAKPCFIEFSVYENLEMKSLINSVTSSKQLVEVLKNSPTHSEANFNLINSSYLGKLEGVQEAIRNGADVNAFRDGESPLIIAAELGDDRLAAYLLTVPYVDVNFRNIFGETPLFIAVRNTFNKIVRLLLNHNADVNITDNMGKSPLHVVLFQERPQMARLLLAYGADYNQWDAFGERPIYTCAVKKPHLECLTLLLNVGASPEYCGHSGTPLISRAIMNWTEYNIIETLVHYGASVNARDMISGKTPLHFAAIINDIRVTKFLFSRGADVNLITVYNATPYEEAISHKSLAVAKFLVAHTINANKRKLSNIARSESRVNANQPIFSLSSKSKIGTNLQNLRSKSKEKKRKKKK